MNSAIDQRGGRAWGAVTELFFKHGRPKIMSAGQELMLSPPQGIVLRFLDQPRPMGELATMMHCDNSNMTGHRRSPRGAGAGRRASAERDRRVKLIELTEDGASVREEMARRIAEPPEAITGLPVADQKALRDILRRALGENAN